MDAGGSDYLIFVFAGLASYNIGDFDSAKNYYHSALDKDSSQIQAWQGIFKIYEANSTMVDEFSIKVVEKLLQSEK